MIWALVRPGPGLAAAVTPALAPQANAMAPASTTLAVTAPAGIRTLRRMVPPITVPRDVRRDIGLSLICRARIHKTSGECQRLLPRDQDGDAVSLVPSRLVEITSKPLRASAFPRCYLTVTCYQW